MTEVENLALDDLRHICGQLDRIENDISAINGPPNQFERVQEKREPISDTRQNKDLEQDGDSKRGHLALRGRSRANHVTLAEQSLRLDRLNARVTRIEKRLDLVEG
jgi:hypothetical protein